MNNFYLAVLDPNSGQASIVRLRPEEHDTIMQGDDEDVTAVAARHGVRFDRHCDFMIAENINLNI